MSERIRELLDDAVAGITPDNPDPVTAVITRGRAARRRTLTTAALAAALLGTGTAVAVTTHVAGTDAPPAASFAPPTPRVLNGEVVAGALHLPIPAGWTVATPVADAPCETLSTTVLISGPQKIGCQTAEIEVTGTASTWPAGRALLPKDVAPSADGQPRADPSARTDLPLIVLPPESVTLPGGEPAWMTDALDSEALAPDHAPGYSYYNVLYLPWSHVSITLRVDGAASRTIIDSIRTEPAALGALVLPVDALSVELTTSDITASDPWTGHAETTDPATITAVTRLLGSQPAVLTGACAGSSHKALRLTLAGDSPDPTSVIITLGDRCQEAVSSAGGRVRLTDATVTELKHLLGLAAR
ncbi:hypothetical protein [Winogradskya humida]|uniref:Uncharacterized protein n=1 Tax=Winogradskya humida TaxID=113566 RepID=A0ABQ3ZWK4_9ACTN|nr:hypothetical protein [Actinoplanes humidus]GIE22567.1 hypothetical protein Ahu01nite_056690 [Actinoplanes humidus]